MTEKEKLQNGLEYNPIYDQELTLERKKAKSICFQYNNSNPTETVQREEILKSLLGSTKKHFYIEPPFFCDYGYNIHIGENFYSNHNLVILDGAKVTIGNNVLIAPNCGIYTAGHPIDVDKRIQAIEYAKPITIKDNVWIGGNVAILPGVTIGENTVIGAGSVVVKDIPSNVVAVGNPCKVIKKRTI